MLARSLVLSLVALTAACGDDGGGTPKNGPQDAAAKNDGGGTPPGDAPAAVTVKAVTCPADPAAVAAVVASNDNNFTSYQISNATIKAGDIVSFKMSPMHDARPRTGKPTDQGIQVDFGGSQCFQFTKAGSFTFYCTAHNFNGTLTVQ